ncbi:hypothetical protein ECC18A13_028660 [Enterobacter sp. 18A13]|jgi:hypothetical protein|nr:hypothetical protein ECC18A13_028660 [Enterobacter sp. 18A13]
MSYHLLQVRQVTKPTSEKGLNHGMPETMH